MTERLEIAIADDEPDTRSFLQGVLQRLGHDVTIVAATGRELVDRCAQARPRLIVTDIKMPDMDGLDAAREIYRSGPIPVIVVSAYHDSEFVARAEENHISAYLVKPIKAANLGPAIAVVMRRFAEFEEMRRQATDLRQALEERKLVERAKGILMREAQLDEASAFRRLQKLASHRSQRLAVVARSIIEASELLRPDRS